MRDNTNSPDGTPMIVASGFPGRKRVQGNARITNNPQKVRDKSR